MGEGSLLEVFPPLVGGFEVGEDETHPVAGAPALGKVLAVIVLRGRDETYPGIPACEDHKGVQAEALPRRADIADDDRGRQDNVCVLELHRDCPQDTDTVVRVDLGDGVRDQVRELDDVVHPPESCESA